MCVTVTGWSADSIKIDVPSDLDPLPRRVRLALEKDGRLSVLAIYCGDFRTSSILIPWRVDAADLRAVVMWAAVAADHTGWGSALTDRERAALLGAAEYFAA